MKAASIINLNSMTGKETIAENEGFRMVSICLEPDSGLPKHRHDGKAVILVLKGKVEMNFTDLDSVTLNQGDVYEFDAKIEHNVVALERSQVVITTVAS